MRQRQEGQVIAPWISPPIRTPLRRGGQFLVKLPQLVLAGQFSPRLATTIQRFRARGNVTARDKLRYKMAHDRRPLLVTFADKLEAREYVKLHGGGDRLTDIYSVAESFSGLEWTGVPDEFVVKVNHGSGGMVCVTKNADPAFRLPPINPEKPWKRYFVHPDSLDMGLLEQWVEFWLARRYRWRRWDYREWAYGQVHPKVFIEEFLGGSALAARNLKLHSFSGVVGTVSVTSHLSTGNEVTEDRFLVTELDDAARLLGVDPADLRAVVTLTEKLSCETDFVRSDWLVTPKGITFGELTNYPAGGNLGVKGTARFSAGYLSDLYSGLWGELPDYDCLPQGAYPLQ